MRNRVRVANPHDIEEVLSDLRQASLSGPALPVMRAAVLNLVAYAPNPIEADELAAQVEGLAEQHPSRTIVLGAGSGQEAGNLEVFVSAHCHPATVDRLVCYEEIEILAGSDLVGRLPAIVLALLLRDLPVILWWPGDLPFGAPLFEQLMARADRLLVDSLTASDPDGFLRRLAALGHAEHCECAVRDLNWDRLGPWRELTAQLFDPPDCRLCLEHLDWVRVAYAGHRGSEAAQAYLLAGWLATRLGWLPEEPATDGARIRLRHGQRRVAVEFVRLATRPGEEPGLRSLAMEAPYGAGRASLGLRRSSERPEAEGWVRLPGREARQWLVPFPLLQVTDLLREEFQSWGADPIYQEALQMAAFFSTQPVAVAEQSV